MKGARSEDRLPLQNKYSQWKDLGVTVVPVLSGAGEKKRYIQDALAEDTVKVPKNSGALLCGQRGMVDSVRDILLTSGVFEGKILLNF